MKTDLDPAHEAVRLAATWLQESLLETSPSESAAMKRISRMIRHPSAKKLSLAMTDRIDRSTDAARVAHVWIGLLDRFGTSSGFSIGDQMMLDLGKYWSGVFPGLVIPAVKKRLEAESRDVILPAEDPALSNYLAAQKGVGSRVNLNQLGEAVLGEKEAEKRLNSAINLLEREDVDYVSVKISAIFSQIQLVAWEESLAVIKARLRKLFQVAATRGKFVNLDMEAYHDLDLTVAAFQEVLSEDAFTHFSAGIALQAYLPDSISIQQRLTNWARTRCSRGGAPIKIRLVKGANIAMETVEAELHGWSTPFHDGKHHTDACFKQMLEYGCQPENAAAVKIGVGSHNLFDIALAMVLRERNGVAKLIEIEMLQGMAPAQARVVRKAAQGLLVYSPIVYREEFGSALAYLIRRLDENTAPGNFLASLFSLTPGSAEWDQQSRAFLSAWAARNQVNVQSKRSLPSVRPTNHFSNEPDTDWTLLENRQKLKHAQTILSLPPQSGVPEIEAALDRAEKARAAWAASTIAERAGIILACGRQLSATRFESIAILRSEGKKAPIEADSEISEAIDFAHYYAQSGNLPGNVIAEPLGTVLVTPPWNFPFAIPCGGVLAALMVGNTVILKPAPESIVIGWWLARQLWTAGVPQDVLQFVACADGEVGRRLIEDPRTSAVVLTGAYETARRFQSWRPGLKLFAETSGKNAIVVSAMADRELAAADLVKSAFGHSGQKCSAASLGILEREVYEDAKFLNLLKDAASSLRVGPAAEPGSTITPLVQPPGESLLRALTTLDEGESWLLKPRVSREDPCLWSPGIKLGVRPGSWFHQTECFGPVLGLMKANDLHEAIEFQNGVAYGLTAGFHSLDEAEIKEWKDRVAAGNLYINRGITGAIVQRQPFGGWKCSRIGPGAKAGGPNYVNLFRTFRDPEKATLEEVERSYRQAWEQHFAVEHDPSALKCESNVFRYRPVGGVLLRLMESGGESELMAEMAAGISGVNLIVSSSATESDNELAARLPGLSGQVEILRTLGSKPSDHLLAAAYDSHLNWIDAPLSNNGRLELTRWLREQSVTQTLHRYGNVI